MVETITGSRTMGILRARLASTPATAFTIFAEPSIPILIESAPMSERQASIWAATISGGTRCTSRTPRVFCAVTAVIAVCA